MIEVLPATDWMLGSEIVISRHSSAFLRSFCSCVCSSSSLSFNNQEGHNMGGGFSGLHFGMNDSRLKSRATETKFSFKLLWEKKIPAPLRGNSLEFSLWIAHWRISRSSGQTYNPPFRFLIVWTGRGFTGVPQNLPGDIFQMPAEAALSNYPNYPSYPSYRGMWKFIFVTISEEATIF